MAVLFIFYIITKFLDGWQLPLNRDWTLFFLRFAWSWKWDSSVQTWFSTDLIVNGRITWWKCHSLYLLIRISSLLLELLILVTFQEQVITSEAVIDFMCINLMNPIWNHYWLFQHLNVLGLYFVGGIWTAGLDFSSHYLLDNLRNSL